jgi:ATP-binding cassette, subfamily B, bacterial
VRAEGAYRRLAITALLSTGSSAVTLLAFLVIGEALLRTGQLGLGTLVGAGAAMISSALVGAIAARMNGLLQLDLSGVLKKRLFEGVLRMPLDKLRHGGIGYFLGVITEAAEFEEAALFLLAGAFQTLAALGVGLFLLAFGAAAWPLIIGFLSVCATLAVIAALHYRRDVRATDLRLATALTIVENIAGQRTRAVQQAPDDWHLEEDALLASYNSAVHSQDAAAIALRVAPRSWLLMAFAILGAALIAGETAGMPAAVVGIIATYQGLQTISRYLQSSIRLTVALRAIRALISYGLSEAGEVRAVVPKADVDRSERIVELRGVRFTYPSTGRLVVDSATFSVADGDRILVTGSSGGGKTTLIHLMSGLRKPDAGLLLLRGADAQALSDDVRRRIIATAPQFHENHILSGSLLFNLLLGRGWPPTQSDVEQATLICVELGLGPLLERMPNRMNQYVGETGWQLSHGERSRVFIARTLLQNAPLVIFDESFGALDTESMNRCMECALKHSSAMLVVAHP